MEEKTREEVQDLEFLDVGQEIKEFVRREPAERTSPRKRSRRKRLRWYQEYSQWLWAAAFLAVGILAAVCGIMLLKAPAATVLLAVLLEAVLAVCLCRSPIWLHGAVICGSVLLGAVFHLTVLMVIAAAVYLAGILILHVMERV